MAINSRVGRWFCIMLLGIVLGGCAATAHRPGRNQQAWGAHATLFPSWDRLTHAMSNAARDPQTWAPAIGAVVFSATDWDKDVSEWAQAHHPVFGSQSAALHASDDLRDGAKYGAIVTALLTPNGPDTTTAVTGKLKGMGLQLGAYFATESVTTALKRGVARQRPNGGNNRSFPSGHTSAAFAAGTLARRNVAVSGFSPTAERVLDIGFVSLGVGTSWARVEAGVHYPSDVLAGAALGHFVAAMVNDAFVGKHRVGEHQNYEPRLSLSAWRGNTRVGLAWFF